MATDEIHLLQARHNERLAKKLINEPPFHDWAIIAAFYSAIHFFEYYMFIHGGRHSETTIPFRDGRAECSPHAHRENLIRLTFPQNVFITFRKLREASETARYLSCADTSIDTSSSMYFKIDRARNLVEKSLVLFKQSLSVPEELVDE